MRPVMKETEQTKVSSMQAPILILSPFTVSTAGFQKKNSLAIILFLLNYFYNADYIKNSFKPGTVYMAVIPALRRQRQEDTHNFKASTVYTESSAKATH